MHKELLYQLTAPKVSQEYFILRYLFNPKTGYTDMINVYKSEAEAKRAIKARAKNGDFVESRFTIEKIGA